MENNKNSNIVDLFLFQFSPLRGKCARASEQIAIDVGATLFALRTAIITLFTEQTDNLTNTGREFMESRKEI